MIDPARPGYDGAVYIATQYALENYSSADILYTDAGNKYAYDKVDQMQENISNGSDLVLAVRVDAANTMLWHQKLGTRVVLSMINLFCGSSVKDISPFRLVRSESISMLNMTPKKYSWPSESLVKALAMGLKVTEVNVQSLPREGVSKVSGSLRNSIRAGAEMMSSLRYITYKGAPE
jgi:hypothetical protein